MVVTSLSAALTAWAAEGDETEPERDPAVVAVEQKISDWYSTHRSKMYSTKEEDAEAKQAARDAYNEISKDIKALSDEQKVEVNLSSYGYWLYTVTIDEAREANEDPTATPKTGDYVDVVMNHMDAVTDVMGELPASYQKAVDAAKPITTTPAYTDGSKNYYLSSNGSVNYKDNQTAQDLLNNYINAYKTFDLAGINFSQAIYPQADQKDSEGVAQTGFYFYASSPNSMPSLGITLAKVIGWVYYMEQDVNASGADPSFDYKAYVTRSGSFGNYTYAWAEGKSAQNYVDDFNAYVEAWKPMW